MRYSWNEQTYTGLRGLLVVVAVACGYALAGYISLTHMTPAENIALFWPAAGLSAGLLIAMGPGARIPVAIAVAIATLAANLVARSSLPVATVFAACNVLECLMVAQLVEQLDREGERFERLRGVMAFIAATISGAALAAVPAALAIKMFGLSDVSLIKLWFVWFRSDAVGIVTVAPLFIMLPSLWRDPLPAASLLEGVSAVALAGVAAIITLGMRYDNTTWPLLAPTTVLFPLFLWLGSRTRPVFSAVAAFVFALVLTWTLIRGAGQLGDPDTPIADRVLAGQLAMLAVSICSLTMAATLTHLGNVAGALKRSEERLRLGLNAGGVYAFDLDMPNRTVERFGGLIDRLGLPASGPLDEYLERLHPQDRQRFNQMLQALSPAQSHITTRYRVRAVDGSHVYIVHRAEASFDADGNLAHIIGTCADVTQRHLAQQRQEVLIAELNHRVKNSLACVIAIMDQSHQGHKSVDDYVDVVTARVMALARIHERLSANKWEGVGLAPLIADELEPYRSENNATIDGPDVVLAADPAQAIALTVHELATNAAKHGALKKDGGRVLVTWRLENETDGEPHSMDAPPDSSDHRVLRIEWQEQTDWDIDTTPKPGFGVNTIRNLLRFELHAQVSLDFAPRGARCTIVIPVEKLASPGAKTEKLPAPSPLPLASLVSA